MADLPAPSYRALFAVPSLGRIVLTMQIARIAQAMVGVVMILFALQRYGSPELAGAVAFASAVPGLLASPLAGALLDRHGRVRLVMLDYAVGAASLLLVCALSLAGALPGWLLVLIAAIAGLTGPLSNSGLRSLFPLLVPERLWERVNAVDSNGWVLATVVGAPFGGIFAQTLGYEPTFVIIGAAFVLAAVILIGAPDPRTDVISTGHLGRDAWQGLVYTWRNPTLRGLAASLSVLNLSGGVTQILVPVLVLRQLGLGQDIVGLMFGISGAFGAIAAFVAGRMSTAGRERRMIVLPSLGLGVAMLLFLVHGSLLPIALCMAVSGLLNGPLDIALFTLRQRRTDPAWMGRAFTVSMNLNFAGFPVGAAITGTLVAISVDAATLFGATACLVAALLAARMIPMEPQAEARASRASDAAA